MIFSKENCGVCQSAKDKLQRLGIEYEELDIEYFTDVHEGWRDDGTVDVLACHAWLGMKIPMIMIDGSPYDYPGAIARLKNAATKART